MAWSLLNLMNANPIEKLLDQVKDTYPPEEPRTMSREKATAVIHAALWAHSSRSDGTAGMYAMMNLYDALGLKFWTFDEGEAKAIQEFLAERRKAAKAAAG